MAEKFADTVPQMPLIGERIPLPSGETLEKPSAEVIAWLQSRDPRIRYFPADMEAAQASSGRDAYSRAVARPIGEQVQRDFPGKDMSVRGTVASLTERFPYWDNDANGGIVGDMNTVLDIAASGSDTGEDRTRVGQLLEDGELNHHTLDWLGVHATSVLLETLGSEEHDQVFPVLLAYPPESFDGEAIHGWNQLSGDPSQRLAAIYITDRVV